MTSNSVAALGIFALTYLIILAGEKSPRKLDRPSAGLLGAVLLVVTGLLTRAEALRAVDWGTLALLFGMMIVVHYALASGLLDRAAHLLLDRTRGPRQLLWLVCGMSGVLSALFVNDTVCLLLTPLLLSLS
ncbi:MAG TPA: SLC13 family permease, partial [Armatimonadota bacterium]|nr:SLC13 family permease [Armatimonadota bacterium]